MKSISKLRAGLVGLGLLSALAATATGQDAGSRIKTQIDHLRQELKSKPDSNSDWKEAKSDIGESLQQADDALRAGHL